MTSMKADNPTSDLLAGSASPSWLPWVGLGAGVLFASLAAAVARHEPPVVAVDQAIHSWMLAHRSSGASALARGIARCGSSRVTLPTLMVVAMLAPRGPLPLRIRARTGLAVVAVAAAGGLVQVGMNHAMNTARPNLADWAGVAGGASFPSGHTTSSALFAGCCIWLIVQRVADRRLRTALTAAALVFAFSVGCSRILLGVHWPSDVLGGWLLSLTWLAGMAAVAARRGLRLPTASPVGERR